MMNIVVNGVRYNIDTWGNGYPLLLLHGFTGHGASWREFEPVWKGHSKAYALDLIGHGKTESSDDLSAYDIEVAARSINSMLEKMDIVKTDVLGYSMGGRLALTFAVNYPDKVRKLILESSSPGLESEVEKSVRREQDEKLSEFIQKSGVKDFVEYWEGIPLFQSQQKLPEVIRGEIKQQRLNNSSTGLSKSLMGMGTGSQPSWWNALQSISIPVLLITGTLDEKFCEIALKMTKRLENCEWISVNHCGHAVHVENKEMFGTIVSKFLFDD